MVCLFKKSPKGYYLLEGFSQQQGLIHGFSTREFGDCNPAKSSNKKNINHFLTALGLEKENLASMSQIHGNQIKIVDRKNRGEIIPNVDGLATKEKGVLLGVKTADCLPLLYYDPAARIIGVAHAGWRGVLKRLPQKMIDLMIKLGSVPAEVIVGIGPHIGDCCYNINAQRAEGFTREFGNLKGMIGKKNSKIYLNLAIPALAQLIHSGVLKKNIALASSCTSCQKQDFFSYRKDSEKTYGEVRGLGVIEMR